MWILLVSDSCIWVPKVESTRELEIKLDGKIQGVKGSSNGFEIKLIKENGSVSVVMD